MESSLRSRPGLLLLTAALLMSLLLGTAFVVMHRLEQLRDATAQEPTRPLSDQETREQVLGAARQFVTAGGLRGVTGSYLLQSCRADGEPPYRGTVYLNFDVPSIAETPAYFREIAAAMRDLGWAEGLAPVRQAGGKVLARDGVSARYHRNPDVPGRGVLRIHGECRNVGDHRADGFVDIGAEVSR